MKDQLDNLTTKERLMQVTINVIAQEGFQSVTIRKVAAKAGVNIAAVNYHFGSKDALINEALKQVTDQIKGTFKYLQTGNDAAEIKLAAFIKNYTDILFKYPDIIKNMINHAIHDKLIDQQVEYIAFLKTEGFELIKHTIGQIRPEQDEDFHSLKALHLFSGLSFPILMGKYIGEVMGVDLSIAELRQLHIKLLMENVCHRN
ncbi:MAG: TetR/AcrR family transcriptional regulator [Syntrophomonadaceae bacterium]|nr:TetR/AcrR family transcriptional regulator [Syntrophomonadaceae bacterium]